MSSHDLDRDAEPPPGVEVMRSNELDPLFGASDRWGYRGVIDDLTVFHCGSISRAVACRRAWDLWDSVARPSFVHPENRAKLFRP